MPTTDLEKSNGWLSVTEVLDTFIPKGLLDWYLKTGKKEAKRLSTVALKIGSRVDALIQEDIQTGSYKLSAKDSIEVKNCMEAWVAFKQDYLPKVDGVQIEVKSEADKLLGHLDLVLDGVLVDVKCASSIKPNHWLQVAKYAKMSLLDIKDVAILRLDKNLGTYQYALCPYDKEVLVRVFDGLLEAHRFYNPPTAVKEE